MTIEKISVNGVEYVRAGTLDEVEPYPDPVSIARGAIVDATLWRHALPRTVK